MTIGCTPYPAMKPSGVEWLGEVPEHWQIVPNRALLRLKKELVGSNSDDYLLLSLTKQGVVVRDMENPEGKFPTQFDSYQVIEPGDLIFCLFDIDETPRTVGLSSLHGMITGAYTRFVCADETARRFVYLLYVALDNGKHLKPLYTGLRKVITKSTFLSAKMPLPSPPEQAAIVRYLDHADRRIRRYIHAKQKLVKLLEEQKQALIHQSVTRGLDPNVRLKPSGVEWLGDVPEHWEMVPFKRRVGFQEGPGIMAADFRDSGVPLLRISCLRGKVATLDGCNYLDHDMVRARWGHFAVGEDDYLLSASANTGAVSLATSEVAGSIPYTGIIRLWPTSQRTVMAYVSLFMSSRLFQNQVDLAKSGVGIEHFGPTHLNRMVITLPPAPDQKAIVDAIKEAIEPLAIETDRSRCQIDLLREYRTRLIVDVVTGKLDVREAAARLPDEVEEPEPLDQADTLIDGKEEPGNDLDATPDEAEA